MGVPRQSPIRATRLSTFRKGALCFALSAASVAVQSHAGMGCVALSRVSSRRLLNYLCRRLRGAVVSFCFVSSRSSHHHQTCMPSAIVDAIVTPAPCRPCKPNIPVHCASGVSPVHKEIQPGACKYLPYYQARHIRMHLQFPRRHIAAGASHVESLAVSLLPVTPWNLSRVRSFQQCRRRSA